MHNDKATWLTVIEQAAIQKSEMNNNWKQPGPEKIHIYWTKKLPALYPTLQNLINEYIIKPDIIQFYLNQGITYLKPKVRNTADPSKFRPIACVNNIYKLFTSCITAVRTK